MEVKKKGRFKQNREKKDLNRREKNELVKKKSGR